MIGSRLGVLTAREDATMSDTTAMLTDSVEGLRAFLSALDDDRDDDRDRDDDGNPLTVDAWAEDALEAYALVRADYTGGGGPQSVTVVTATGGPHVEAVCRMDGAGSFTVEGYWGSDRVSRHGTSQAFEAWCDDYVSGLAYGWGE